MIKHLPVAAIMLLPVWIYAALAVFPSAAIPEIYLPVLGALAVGILLMIALIRRRASRRGSPIATPPTLLAGTIRDYAMGFALGMSLYQLENAQVFALAKPYDLAVSALLIAPVWVAGNLLFGSILRAIGQEQ